MSDQNADLQKYRGLPGASDEEFEKRIVQYADVPMTELVPGCDSHLIFGERVCVSFLTMSADTVFPPHRHEAEQIMCVLEGYMDEIIEGKLYRVKAGDVINLPSNIEHGGVLYDVDCKVIDIFSPPREDFREKYLRTIGKSK